MTSSCIRLVWQPIQHKDRQRAESGETDSWVAANRQGGPTKLDKIKNFHLTDSIDTENSSTHGWSDWVRSSQVRLLDSSLLHNSLPERVGPAPGNRRGAHPSLRLFQYARTATLTSSDSSSAPTACD